MTVLKLIDGNTVDILDIYLRVANYKEEILPLTKDEIAPIVEYFDHHKTDEVKGKSETYLVNDWVMDHKKAYDDQWDYEFFHRIDCIQLITNVGKILKFLGKSYLLNKLTMTLALSIMSDPNNIDVNKAKNLIKEMEKNLSLYDAIDKSI